MKASSRTALVSLQWLLFAVEVVFLFFLLTEVFLVPQMAAPWGDLRFQLEWAALSLVFALASGMTFNHTASSPPTESRSLLKAPPVVIWLTVVAVVLIPAAMKWRSLSPSHSVHTMHVP
ncbi:membrane protein YdbS with pleckstrin-like domain [Edaphobacter lichenicola]|uniref:Membrane protein YdbS with pleckstrin-like domain n=1 Tax=Tunturiibacter empetritectus TaxID=3069691 RepID=A0A7W8IKK5_9BACT|nr:membrane protein YdbS with pleckstrin-like domain [Edaphobacter lichenicola]